MENSFLGGPRNKAWISEWGDRNSPQMGPVAVRSGKTYFLGSDLLSKIFFLLSKLLIKNFFLLSKLLSKQIFLLSKLLIKIFFSTK